MDQEIRCKYSIRVHTFPKNLVHALQFSKTAGKQGVNYRTVTANYNIMRNTKGKSNYDINLVDCFKALCFI